ncbi:MAG TPA: carbohydrate ABC transporter permease [Saccharofermentans sp.]|jgi:multiple sugar transport system permease protein|nr:carbohydrate ABC transporter permease [Saccharofermentans sp.]HPE28419.1 carbohydrate ABC transporter permease [Saccharofermentans sp.]HPJ80625.1 carbohydrate ABC transporter permease [Saccharofermentans sp.]HPQ32474.1 carbohydrate ABC transporter permease [Saccharofermentans sp.]HRV50860.1 carbohydrate ABC transporter permease [Saccharofermentans sp.]
MDKDNKDTRSDDEIIATKFVRRSDKNVSMKATSDLQERRLQAQMARRKVFVSSEKFSSIFDSMTQEEKNAYFDKERRRAKGVLRRRTIGRNIWTGVGVVIASIAAIIAILPLFFTFLNSFMTSAEINDNYGMVFQSLSGHSDSAAKYLSSTPVLKLIPEQVTIEQYKTLMFMSPTYLLKFWNSIILVVPIVIGQMLVACLAAYSFSRYRRKRREILFFSYIILMLMPFQVTLVPNYIVAEKLGILDSIWAIILPGVFSTFSVFLLAKYMRQIPSSYIEAAKLDGASEWQIFTRIAIPMCKSALYAMSILLFIDYWNMVEQPLVLLTSVDKQPLSVFLSQVNEAEIGIAFAASALYMIPPILIFLYGEEYLVEGISRSGIK